MTATSRPKSTKTKSDLLVVVPDELPPGADANGFSKTYDDNGVCTNQAVTPELLELFPRPMLFHNLVWIAEPKLKRGSIVLEPKSVLTQVTNTNYGLLLKKGALSFKAQTPGLDYTQEKPAEVGDWVMFQRHSGHRRQVRIDINGPLEPQNLLWVVTITDTDITDVGSEDQMRRMVGWVD